VFHVEIDKEEQVAPPVMRQTDPPSTRSKEVIPQDPVGRSSLPGQFVGDQTSEDAKGADGSRDCTNSEESCFKGSMVLQDRWILDELGFNQECIE
jgi:hypothetical protein